MIWEFEVNGIPQPKGSTRAFVNRRTGRAMTTSANPKLKDWEQLVRSEAQSWPHGVVDCAVAVRVAFALLRPASVSVKKRPHSTAKPDLDKLVRGLLDALTGIVWRDDSQVISILASKAYGERPGIKVTIETVVE